MTILTVGARCGRHSFDIAQQFTRRGGCVVINRLPRPGRQGDGSVTFHNVRKSCTACLFQDNMTTLIDSAGRVYGRDDALDGKTESITNRNFRPMSLLIVFYVFARRAIDTFSKSEPEPRRRIERDLFLSRSDIDRKIIGGRSAFSGTNSGLAV